MISKRLGLRSYLGITGICILSYFEQSLPVPTMELNLSTSYHSPAERLDKDDEIKMKDEVR